MVFGFGKKKATTTTTTTTTITTTSTSKVDDNDDDILKVEKPRNTSFKDEILGNKPPPTRKKKVYTDEERGKWWGELLGEVHNVLREEPGLEPDPEEDIPPVDIDQLVDGPYLDDFWKEYDEGIGRTYIPDRYYYKDRVGVTRGPANIEDLQLAFASGFIDRDTFVWGHNMDEFAPLACVRGLESQVATLEVKFAKWATFAVAQLNPFPKFKKASRLAKLKGPAVKQKADLKVTEKGTTLVVESETLENDPKDIACRYTDFPWSGGSGGLPYEGMLDPTMPRGKRIPFSLRQAIKEGNPHWAGKDKEWVAMESFYFNWLHPLDNQEIYDQWYGREDRSSSLAQNFWHYKIQRHLEHPLESFSEYEDPYNDNLGGVDTSEKSWGVQEFPFWKKYIPEPIPTSGMEDYIEEEGRKAAGSPYAYTPEQYELLQKDLKAMGLPEDYKLPAMQPWRTEEGPKATITEVDTIEEVEEEYEEEEEEEEEKDS